MALPRVRGMSALDKRGLHQHDSGWIYAVRANPGGKSRRKWFKTESEARHRAAWWNSNGVDAEVIRYRISDEDPVS